MVVWNLEHLYPFKETEQYIQVAKDQVSAFSKHRASLKPDMQVEQFFSLVKELEIIAESIMRLEAYAGLWITENQADSKRLAHETMISEFVAEMENELIFFNLWFKALSEQEAQRFIKASGKYHYFLETIRRYKPYSLQESEERIISLKSLTGGSALIKMYDIITNRYKYTWENEELPEEKIRSLFTNKERTIRKQAYELILNRYSNEEEILGELYKEVVNDHKNEAIKIRKFSKAISARNIGNDIPDEAVTALLSVVRKNVKVFQEYYTLKAKLFNKKLDRFDLYAPYKGKEKSYDYETSKKIVLETFKKFSPEAHRLAQKIFDDQHVHSEFTPNKRSGAFCYSTIISISPYILLNHTDTLRDLFTMMHEFGHGIHALAAHNQTPFTFHSSLPLAESASTFAELLLSTRLLKEADEKEKITLLVREIDSQYATILRQAFFIFFELEAHEMIANGCTVEDLNKKYLSLLKEQFGDVLPLPDIFKHEWKTIPHIYHTPFYCYAYTFGNLLVLALFDMYEKEGESFVPKFMKLLSYGGSEAPADILKELDIDITTEAFWERGFSIIKKRVSELRSLV